MTLHSAQRLQATNADCDAGDAWQEYLEEHPGIDRDDPGFFRLIRHQIKTRKRFAKIHNLPISEHTDYLRRLLLRSPR